MNEPALTPSEQAMLASNTAEESRYGSRKWLLALLVVALSTGLLWVAKIDAAQWVDCIVWTVGLYAGGNVGASLAAVWGRRP